MEKQGDEIHLDDTEAKAGETSGHMRWVLGIGTVLAIVLLSLIWMTGAWQEGEKAEEARDRGDYAQNFEDSGDDTDSIVSDRFDEVGDADGAEVDTPAATIENETE
ncbi:hypothetical protein P7228_09635 [Altererythrobacter arenosus]|uniref:Uncharacterized protein n=1 Tax=Altererythrobacter arenosus TaxID=3032592 RepID=A0ABY8FMK2_9SPHN|nr:hypothetical protein [Altererythrobacter sp. CAU 1644]WFL76259.1 hypothetical protein P7228_09635 [Altererythrobacter sp. CAU 1644]